MFTLFFATIAYYRGLDPVAFAVGRESLSLVLGVVNTFFLLTGSWFVVRGVRYYGCANRTDAARYLLLGAVTGLLFLFNKAIEWSELARRELTPNSSEFYMVYYVFTAIHGFHVVIGSILLLTIYGKLQRQGVLAASPADESVAGVGLFWHMIDLLWIMLFSLFYLSA